MMAVLDPETMQKQPLETIRRRIVEVGGDWNPAESKKDLMVRLAQLEGSPDVAEKIKKQMSDAGFSKEERPIYSKQEKLNKAQMDKIMKPYVSQGLEFVVSKDGETWAMRFDTGRKHDKQPVIVRDSGSTTVPVKVLAQCAELLLQQRRRPKASQNKADSEFVEGEAA